MDSDQVWRRDELIQLGKTIVPATQYYYSPEGTGRPSLSGGN
jgi:hypothetical protein